MHDFLVVVGVDIPYPKTYEYIFNTSSAGVSCSRAIRKVRMELKGKRIKEWRVKVIQL